MSSKTVFLSHILDCNTPTYGNRHRFEIEQRSSISNGDIANDSFIKTTVHVGTHIDMPFHFYDNGQCIEDFSADFWVFTSPEFIEIKYETHVVYDEVIEAIKNKNLSPDCDVLIIKTGIGKIRDNEIFWKENPGISPKIAEYLRVEFPKIRVLGFDSISVSSFSERMIGREAHRQFLNPEHPILLLEDMNLNALNNKSCIERIVIAPLRIAKCDGLPCTVIATIKE